MNCRSGKKMNKKIELYSEMYYDNKRPDDAEK